MYLCNGISNSVNALTSTGEDTTLWHHRLRHMSEKGMQILHSRNLLPSLKHVDLIFCENCVYGKNMRVKFLRVGKEKKRKKLELVHTNVWDLLRYHLLVALVIMLLLLMMQLEKPRFIVFKINLIYLILLRNKKIWLEMR